MHPRLLLVFALLTSCLCAQSDYQLFRPGVQYLYDQTDVDITDGNDKSRYMGIKVDSLGCQEVYTSLSIRVNANYYDYDIKKIPSPFGLTVCQEADRTVMNYGASGQLLLHPEAPVGTEWIAQRNGVENLGARVTRIGTGMVLGVQDTVKTITFQYGTSGISKEVLISKNLGLVSGFFPNYGTLQLAGSSLGERGIQLQKADSLYGKTQVGNIYHLERIETLWPVPGRVYDQHHQETHLVTSVDSIVGGTTYFTTVGDLLAFKVPIGSSVVEADSVLTRDTVRHLSYHVPAELLALQPGAIMITDTVLGYLEYRARALYEGPCGLLTTKFTFNAAFVNEDTLQGEHPRLGETKADNYTLYLPFPLETQMSTSTSTVVRLKYMQVEDRVCGTPLDFSGNTVATDDDTPGWSVQVNIYPNPASDRLTVELPPSPTAYNLEFYSVSGGRLRTITDVRGKTTVDVENLPAGSYFILLLQDGRPLGRKRFTVF